jgi:hypothetical protein
MSEEAENAGVVWIAAMLAFCLAVIVGCPLVRRERARQEVRGWQCEQVEGFRMTATNGTIFIEIGGDRNGD